MQKVRILANVFHNSTGHFWEVSGHIVDKIEPPSYLACKVSVRRSVRDFRHLFSVRTARTSDFAEGLESLRAKLHVFPGRVCPQVPVPESLH